MQVKKIAHLSEEEIALFSKAGELAGSIRKAFEAEEIDEFSEENKGLIKAVAEVFSTISK